MLAPEATEQSVEVLEPEPVASAGVPAVKTTGWLQCPAHPSMSYLAGGFCTSCYEDQTLARVRMMDEGFAQLMDESTFKLREVLQLPVDAQDIGQLKAVLGPLMRAIKIVENRFRRPWQLNVNHKVKAVAIVGSPVDFREAAKKQP